MKKPFLSHSILMACLATAALTGVRVAHAKDPSLYFYPASKWNVSSLQTTDSKGAPLCSIYSEFNNGYVVEFTGNAESFASINIDFRQDTFETNKIYAVKLSVPGVDEANVASKAYQGNAIALDLREEKAFSKSLINASVLDLEIEGNAFRFYMTGLSAALKDYRQCAGVKPVEAIPDIALEDKIEPAPAPQKLAEVKPEEKKIYAGNAGAEINEPAEPAAPKTAAKAIPDRELPQSGKLATRDPVPVDRQALSDQALEEIYGAGKDTPDVKIQDVKPVKLEKNATPPIEKYEPEAKFEPKDVEVKAAAEKAPAEEPSFGDKLASFFGGGSSDDSAAEKPVEVKKSVSKSEVEKAAAKIRAENERARLDAQKQAAAPAEDSLEIASAPTPVKPVKTPTPVIDNYKSPKPVINRAPVVKMDADFTNIDDNGNPITAAAPEKKAQSDLPSVEEIANIEPAAAHSIDSFTDLRDKIADLEKQVVSLKSENTNLKQDVDETLNDARKEQLSVSSDNWNLERATMRFNEAERQISRLGRQLQTQQNQCEVEKKDLEGMLFDPQVTDQQQLAKLAALEAELEKTKADLLMQKRSYDERINILEEQLGQ